LPEFADEDSCRVWLAGLPLTNITLAQTRLTLQLNLLNRYPLRTDRRLRVLELLEEPIAFVQEQCLLRYAGRPLPFNVTEQAAFDSSQALWQELVTGYLHCLDAAAGPAAGAVLSPHQMASLAATRALKAMSAIYFDACQANFLTAPTFWRQLHMIFAAAEAMKASQLPIEDDSRYKSTAASAYVVVLLLAASAPIELGPKQRHLVVDWAQRWANKVTVLNRTPADQRTPPLCVDLSSDQAATFQQHPAQSDVLRWLDLSELRKSIKKRLVLLAQGESPQALQLGKDCEQPGCEALLKRIYRCWCKGGLKEDAAKVRSTQHGKPNCHVVSGFEAIHYQLTGQITLKQDGSIYLKNRQHEEIATFGRTTTYFAEGNGEPPDLKLEEWRIIDQHAAALRLERPLSPPGKPMAREQLVAVRIHDGEGFMLGKLVWIAMSASRDALVARIDLFPGRPEGAGMRRVDPGPAHVQYSRCLFLPDVDQLGEAASMLLPAGWFAANRILAVKTQTEETRQVRLDRLVGRGADFERATFVGL
jgi:hypothetical protein